MLLPFSFIVQLTCEEDLADELVPADGVEVHDLHVERAVADLDGGREGVKIKGDSGGLKRE